MNPIPPGALDFESLRTALASRAPADIHVDGFAESAVLVPILVEPGAPERVILTLRHASMRSHAGQISFPGGRRDAADADLAFTAVREAREELGIAAARVEVLGRLDEVPTPTGYNITPIVARVLGPVALAPSASEVAEVFFVALSSLREPAAYRSGGVREFLGVRYEMHEYHVGERRIWGATARILRQLLDLLAATGGLPDPPDPPTAG